MNFLWILYARSFSTEAIKKKSPTDFTQEYGHAIQIFYFIIIHKAQI